MRITCGTIWWDFDGTLISRPAMWAEAASRIVRKVIPGRSCPDASLLRALDEGMPWHRRDRAHPELTTPQDWWRCVFRRYVEIFEELGLAEATRPEALDEIRRDILMAQRYSIYPDVEAVLNRLSDAGWRHVMVSNHVPELPELVERLGLARHFGAIVTSGLVGYEKPHLRMFEVARTHTFAGKPVWMIGDNLVSDCLSVEALGVRAILVRASAEPAYERQAADLWGAVRLIERDSTRDG
jgi:HAD superfamily hydrolase (TIGR01549 family)